MAVAEGKDEVPLPNTIMSTNTNLPAGTKLERVEDEGQRLTADANAAIINIQQADSANRIVSFELDEANEVLNIYTPSIDAKAVERLLPSTSSTINSP